MYSQNIIPRWGSANQLREASLSLLRACAITCYYSATSSRSVKSNIHATHRLLLQVRAPVLLRSCPYMYTDTCLSGRDTRDMRVRKRERGRKGERGIKRTHSPLRPLILTEGDGVCTVAPTGYGFGGESKTPTTLVQQQCLPVRWVNRLLTLTDAGRHYLHSRNRSIKATHTRTRAKSSRCIVHSNTIIAPLSR